MLDVWLMEELERQGVPPTYHLLHKCDRFFHDSLPKDTFKITHEGREYSLLYNTLEGITEYVINSPFYTEDWARGMSTDIDHPSSTEGWKVYQDELHDMINAGHELILPVLWLDKYGAQESRKKSFCSVMITFANFSKKVSNAYYTSIILTLFRY